MRKDETLQRLANTVLEVLNASDEFRSACEHLEDVGFKRTVGITIKVSDSEMIASAKTEQHFEGTYQFPGQSETATAADANFLRSLRILPDLEAR